MSQSLLNVRLRALGVEPDTLPDMGTCSNCNGTEDTYKTFDVWNDTWEIGCYCGNCSFEGKNLVRLIEKWNKAQ